MKKIRVLVADDHKILRESLVILLQQKENIEVVSEAADGHEAMNQALRLRPDIVILDISLPRLNGLEVAANLKNQGPGIKVIILTMHKNEEFVRRAYEAGVVAYLLKENALDELLRAIEVVAGGGVYISDKIAPTIISGFLGNARSDRVNPKEPVSLREREVLQLLAEGHTNKEIADVLSLSLKTVETHRANIMRKLSFRSITDLVLYAVRNHIIEP